MEKKIDWEQRRYEAALHILAAMYGNANNRFSRSLCPSDMEEIENAVILSEHLMTVLADENRPCSCAELLKESEDK